MGSLEDFDENKEPEPIEGEPVPEHPGWAKTLAWAALIVGGLYMLNPTLGVDILPDNLPLLGNLDEAAILLLMLGAFRYLGIALPEFIERWIQPVPRLPSSIEHRDE